jgi:ankyrin repeat protein
MEEIKCISMEEVRQLIRRLILAGYDCRVPKTHSDQEIHANYETSVKCIVLARDLKKELSDGANDVRENSVGIRSLFNDLKDHLLPVCESIDTHPVNQSRAASLTDDSIRQNSVFAKCNLEQELRDLAIRAKRVDAENQFDEAEDAPQPLDSDEETQLHAELDALVEMQERVEAIGGNQNKYMASVFQRACLQITDIEGMYLELTHVFRCVTDSENVLSVPTVNLKEFSMVLDKLSLSAISQSDFEEIFEEGLRHRSFTVQSVNTPDASNSEGFKSKTEEPQEQQDEDSRVMMTALIVGSEEFRSRIMSLATDESFCQMSEASSLMHLNEAQIKMLSAGGRLRTVAKGEVFLHAIGNNHRLGSKPANPRLGEARLQEDDTTADDVEMPEKAPQKAGHESPVARNTRYSSGGASPWFLVVSGSLTVEDDPHGLEQRLYTELGPGSIFGGYKALTDSRVPFAVRAAKGCQLLELPRHNLLGFRAMHSDDDVRLLASRMGEAPISAQMEANTRQDERVVLDAARSMDGPLPQTKLQSLKSAFTRIEQVWQEICLGEKFVPLSQFAAFQPYLGEVGSELYKKLFALKEIPDQISKAIYWEIWINFLTFETYGKGFLDVKQKEIEAMNEVTEPLITESESTDENGHGCFELLHARFSTARRLSTKLFESQVVERYESTFIAVTGDLGAPLQPFKVHIFLERLFPEFEYPVSGYNCKEFLQAFGRDGLKTKQITFADIRKVLMERSKEAHNDGILINGALNSNADLYVAWQRFISAVAGLQYIFVPVRLSLIPWKSMLDLRALGLDLVLDVLTLLHVVVLANTAYRNARGQWVTARLKLIRRINIYCLVAALPLDWFAFIFGASYEMCNWLRMFKLLLPFQIFVRQSGQETAPKTTGRRMIELCMVIFALLHMAACVWFYIGNRYKEWYPGSAVSWNGIDPSLLALSHLSYHNRYGLKPNSTVWDQYLLSLYWVTATLTSYGIVGDLLPQNTTEIIYCMVLMVLNITVFAFIIGEVSSVFMIQDEEVTKARTQLGAVESFVQGSGLEDDLTDEIKSHFRASRMHASSDQTTIFRRMSRSLQVEVSSYTTRGYLDGLQLFQGCSPQLIDAVSVLLSEATFAPEDYLYRNSEIAKEMFLVIDGSVDEISESEKGEKVDTVVKAGGTIGVLSFFFGMRHLTSARAGKLGGAVCLRLARDEFMDMLKLYPEEEGKIAQSALVSFEGARSQYGSRRASSRAASTRTGESNALSSHVGASSDGHRGGAQSSNEGMGSSDAFTQALGGSGIRQRMAMLKRRRENKRIYGILTAAGKGDLNRLKASLQNEGDCNICDHFRRTPLHVAAAQGQLEAVRILLAARADLEARDRFENTPLNEAVRHRHDAVAALFRERSPGLSISLKGHEIGGLMCQAAYEGDLDHVRRLIENRASPSACDYDRRSALHLACCEGHAEIVKYLLEVQADPHARDRFDGTSLDDAVRHSHAQLQKILYDHGARLNGEKYAFKICEAAAQGDLDIIRTLVENGVDTAIGDYDGRTALHLAASQGEVSVLNYLLEKEPPLDVNCVDRVGGTPLEDAMRHGQNVAGMMLEGAGGMRRHEKGLCEFVGRYLAHLEPNRIDVLLRARRGKVSSRLKKQREDGVRAATEDSTEAKALEAIRDLLLPALRSQVTKLRELFGRLVDDIRTTCPILLTALRIHGNGPSQKRGFAQGLLGGLRGDAQPADLSNLDGNHPIEITHSLHSHLHELAVAIAAARESIDAPLPRCRLVQMFARSFRRDIAELRLEVRRSADTVRLLRRILRGAQTVFRTRTFRNILRRAISVGSVFRTLGADHSQARSTARQGLLSDNEADLRNLLTNKKEAKSAPQKTRQGVKGEDMSEVAGKAAGPQSSKQRQGRDAQAIPKLFAPLTDARKDRMRQAVSFSGSASTLAGGSGKLSSPIDSPEGSADNADTDPQNVASSTQASATHEKSVPAKSMPPSTRQPRMQFPVVNTVQQAKASPQRTNPANFFEEEEEEEDGGEHGTSVVEQVVERRVVGFGRRGGAIAGRRGGRGGGVGGRLAQ